VYAWEGGACSVPEIADATRATTGCGGCRNVVCGLVDWLGEVDPPTAPGEDGDFSHDGPGRGEAHVAAAQHDDVRAEISAP
jgi:hypothetical protein